MIKLILPLGRDIDYIVIQIYQFRGLRRRGSRYRGQDLLNRS